MIKIDTLRLEVFLVHVCIMFICLYNSAAKQRINLLEMSSKRKSKVYERRLTETIKDGTTESRATTSFNFVYEICVAKQMHKRQQIILQCHRGLDN